MRDDKKKCGVCWVKGIVWDTNKLVLKYSLTYTKFDTLIFPIKKSNFFGGPKCSTFYVFLYLISCVKLKIVWSQQLCASLHNEGEGLTDYHDKGLDSSREGLPEAEE